MNVIRGEPSGRTCTSLGMKPKVLLYHSHVFWYSATSITIWPSLMISEGLAGGRCVSLTRFGAAPSLKVRAERRVSAGDSELPYTTSTRKPEGSERRERRPPPGSRQVSIGEAPGSCEILIRSVSLGTHSPKPTNFALGARCTR